MMDYCYLVLSENGIQRMTKRPAGLRRGELAVRVAVSIADNAFTDPPISATIEIPDSAIIRPTVSVDVQEPEA